MKADYVPQQILQVGVMSTQVLCMFPTVHTYNVQKTALSSISMPGVLNHWILSLFKRV